MKSIMCNSGSKCLFQLNKIFLSTRKVTLFPLVAQIFFVFFLLPERQRVSRFFPLVWLSVSFDARGDPYRDDWIGYRKIIGVMIRRAWRLAAVSWMNESTVRSSGSFEIPNGSFPRSSGREDSNLLVHDVHLLFDIRIRSVEKLRRPY